MSHVSKSLVASMIGAAMAVSLVGCMPSTTASSRSASAPGVGSETSNPPSASTAITPPVPADFVVGVIVTEQKCFGSAGCNYRYTINPQYLSANPLPVKTTVVYTVTGGDQDQIGNFVIDQDGTATFDRETLISGSEGANLRATVTRIVAGR